MPSLPRAGDRVEGHRLEREIGRGATGAVFVARHGTTGRLVALKLVTGPLAEDPAFVSRFAEQARATALIAHPNVVSVLGHGVDRGRPWMAMRLVPGPDLRVLLRRLGRLAPDQALGIGEQVAAGLDAAHARGLVHRDVKPANVLVEHRDGGALHVELVDFGLVAPAGRRVPGGEGTPGYAGPEQLAGGPVTAATDVHALACLLREMLTGDPAAAADRPEDPAATRAVLRVLAGASSAGVGERPATAGALAAAARVALATTRGLRPRPVVAAEAVAPGGAAAAVEVVAPRVAPDHVDAPAAGDVPGEVAVPDEAPDRVAAPVATDGPARDVQEAAAGEAPPTVAAGAEESAVREAATDGAAPVAPEVVPDEGAGQEAADVDRAAAPGAGAAADDGADPEDGEASVPADPVGGAVLAGADAGPSAGAPVAVADAPDGEAGPASDPGADDEAPADRVEPADREAVLAAAMVPVTAGEVAAGGGAWTAQGADEDRRAMERPTLVSAASPRRSSRRTRTRALVLVPMLVLAFGGSALALVRFGTDDGGSDSGPGARGGGSASGTASGATTTQAARPTAGPAPTAVAPSRAGSGPGASSSGGGTGSLAGGSAPRAGADAPGAPATTGGTTPSLAGGGPGVGPSAVGPRLPGSVRFGGGGWALDLPRAAGWRQTAAQEVEGGRRLTVRLLRPDGARLIAVHLPGQAAVYGPWGGTRFAVRLPRVGTTVGRTFRGGRYAACRRGVCSALVVNGSVGGVLLVAASGSADASRRLVVRSARGLTVD